ncbi:MAG: hypothetical protein ACYC7J_16685 [Syntrophales bacterium]
MNDQAILEQLEELAERLSITVRYENIARDDAYGRGGLCRVKGEYVLLVHSRATLREKIRMIAKSLSTFDLGGMYVLPALRELLDSTDPDG